MKENLKILNDVLKQIDYEAKTKRYLGQDKSTEIAYNICNAAMAKGSGFICMDDKVLVYNGLYWVNLTPLLKVFLKETLQRYWQDEVKGSDRTTIENLYKQFHYTTMCMNHDQADGKINFENGTLDLTTHLLGAHNPKDYFRYVLPYAYDPTAKCPLFMKYLEEVLPEPEERLVIAEYIGYLFTPLKLEKVLFLHGSGLNGKSVLVDIIEALLGHENVSHESLSDMCGENGGANSRMNLLGKLLNTCSDVSAKAFQGDVFKRLASGEPISFKVLYQDVGTSTDYAKQLFCLNELPKTSDTSNGYFRRFLIAPFPVQIPKSKINPRLAQEIIATELPGIMNWVLEGRKRLIEQQTFTESRAMRRALEDYRGRFVKKNRFSLLLPSTFKRE